MRDAGYKDGIMNKMMDITKTKFSFLNKIRNSRYNRFFEFDIIMEPKEDGYTVNLSNGVEVGFSDYDVMIFLRSADIMLMFEETISLWSEKDLEIGHWILYEKYLDNMSYDELANLLYELTEIFAGAALVSVEKGTVYQRNEYHNVYYFDVYVNNYYSLPYNKTLGNITFHVNENIIEKDECMKDIDVVVFEEKNLCDSTNLSKGLNKVFFSEPHLTDMAYLYRAITQKNSDEDGQVFCRRDNKAAFSVLRYSNGTLFECRGIKFFLRYNSEGNNFLPSDNVVEVYNHTLEELSAVEFHEEAARIRLLLTGAGDISYEERLDNEGKLTGYDIYIEKEYDESYIREYDNITFHVNDGYVHKTEQERLEDYLVDNSDKIITVQDVVKFIMHPLQITKASRFLCYRLEGEDTKSPIIYFNGKEGDFYLKGYEDMLILHCRDMAIIFNSNEIVIDDFTKAEMCIEDDDFVMFYKDEVSNNTVDIFRIAYEMIFILAGAGEVNHEMITAEHEENRYVISLEKEYIKLYSRSFGNVSFEVREEYH